MADIDVGIEATAPRTLVLCFDGTAGQFDSDNTNVVKLFSALRKEDTDEQRTYYQPGIGTYFQPGVVSPMFAWGAKLLDEAIAWYLDEHVMDGYKFLMRNYRKGDKICLFGFSRAVAYAYNRCKVGLLPPDNFQSVTFAYKLFARTDKNGIKLAAAFKKDFCRDINVEFVGVWDSVQSTGILFSRSLPFTDSNTCIKTFRHALALDEASVLSVMLFMSNSSLSKHRAKFRPNLYHRPATEKKSKLGQTVISGISRIFRRFRSEIKVNDDKQTDYGTFEQDSEPIATDVLEVWFAGCHSDIGGGNVTDDVKISLAQITLQWMVHEITASGCGILFKDNELKALGITPAPISEQEVGSASALDAPSVKNGDIATIPHSDSSGGSQSSNPEFENAIAPLFDDLQISKVWWLLEMIPLPWSWQDDNGTWHEKWSIHLGKGRIIPYTQPKFHHTVKLRMDYKPLSYTPRAIYDHQEIYV
ncbi:hypothetical protein ID866_8191 [Astraeus odoratus]|nr:hypothetical protein ID866_8191 [Astraeus odoratus]